MNITAYIKLLILFILLLTSCGNKNTVVQHNSSKIEIPKIEVIDSVYFNQLTDIIFNSDCFELHKSDRKVITLYYDNVLSPDLLLVSIWYFTGFDEKVVKEFFGGLYITRNNTKYIFLINGLRNIPVGVFRQTDGKIDVSGCIGAMEGSDSNIGIQKIDEQLKIVYVNCPEFE